jgi:hypothetical protein
MQPPSGLKLVRHIARSIVAVITAAGWLGARQTDRVGCRLADRRSARHAGQERWVLAQHVTGRCPLHAQIRRCPAGLDCESSAQRVHAPRQRPRPAAWAARRRRRLR